MDKYEIVETIGTGSFGVVNKAIEKATKTVVALKAIYKTNYGAKELKNFRKECKIHAYLCHPNIIRMLESFETPDNIFVVTEFAAIDLHQYMKRRRTSELDADHVQSLTVDLVSALFYLHSHRVMHRDLKPQNILLNENGREAKLCDFGLARNFSRDTHLLTSIKGTPLYMAPEVMDGDPYDSSADLWSLGCIVFEMLVGHPLFKAKSLQHLQNLMRQPIVWPKNCAEDCSTFLQGLLEKDPKKRYVWKDVLFHPFVKDRLAIIDDHSTDLPLTNPLTASQSRAKEEQRKEILTKKNRKIIAEKAKFSQIRMGTDHRHAAAIVAQQKQLQGDETSISSMDSIQAIIQTDVDTDVENASAAPPFVSEAILENSNLVIQRFTANAVDTKGLKANDIEPTLDNSNLIIGTLADNLRNVNIDDHTTQVKSEAIDGSSHIASAQQSTSKDLEKRKLNQNLDNFSIRLGNASTMVIEERNPTTSSQRENEKDNEKQTGMPIVETNVNVSDSPIENEEWLAFIRSSMQEVLSGQIDSLRQPNLVTMIVAILRNVNASSKVVESVVQLLILPFVLPFSDDDLAAIERTYVQAKILPNLIFASKLICEMKSVNQSHSSNASTNSSLYRTIVNDPDRHYTKMGEFSGDQLTTLLHIYELACQLLHMNVDFLNQFCGSIHLISSDLFVHILADATQNATIVRLSTMILAMLCYTLREVPEKAVHIEKIIFDEDVRLVALLNYGDSMLRARVCMCLRVAGRFSCFALQKVWTPEIKAALETLATDDDDETVQEHARGTIDELSYHSFYDGPKV